MTRAFAREESSANLDPNGDWARFDTSIKRLIAEMSRPNPDRAKVTSLADAAITPLRRRLSVVSERVFSTADVEHTIASFNDPDAWKNVGDWDHAVQRYLGIVSIRQAWVMLAPERHSDHEALRKELDRLRSRLRFDEAGDGPRGGFASDSLHDRR
jgi:hypothetical protein